MAALVLNILLALFPTYAFVAGGFIARRWCRLSQEWIAKSLFYVFVPLVVFKGALFSDIQPFLLLIALSFSVSLLMVAAASFISERFQAVLAPGTLKCAFGYFNIGWFGIPVVHALYGNDGSIVMTALYIGGMLFGNSVGYLLIASDKKENAGSIRTLLKVPSLYCAAIAFLAHGFDVRQMLMASTTLVSVLNFAMLMTSVLGMGLVGMSVANITVREIPWRKLGMLVGTRLICAIAIVHGLAVILNRFGFFTPIALRVFLFIPLLPVSANMLVFASRMRNENEFVGVTLMTSTLLSCVLLVCWLVFWH